MRFLGGRGFGLLEGGLGLVAAACARLGLMLLRSGHWHWRALLQFGTTLSIVASDPAL